MRWQVGDTHRPAEEGLAVHRGRVDGRPDPEGGLPRRKARPATARAGRLRRVEADHRLQRTRQTRAGEQQAVLGRDQGQGRVRLLPLRAQREGLRQRVRRACGGRRRDMRAGVPTSYTASWKRFMGGSKPLTYNVNGRSATSRSLRTEPPPARPARSSSSSSTPRSPPKAPGDPPPPIPLLQPAPRACVWGVVCVCLALANRGPPWGVVCLALPGLHLMGWRRGKHDGTRVERPDTRCPDTR